MDYTNTIDRLNKAGKLCQDAAEAIAVLTAKVERLEKENTQLRAELANYSQVTDWLRRNGFESFGALTEAFEQVNRDRADLKNELCYKCGNYEQAHNGWCNHCRWKEK